MTETVLAVQLSADVAVTGAGNGNATPSAQAKNTSNNQGFAKALSNALVKDSKQSGSSSNGAQTARQAGTTIETGKKFTETAVADTSQPGGKPDSTGGSSLPVTGNEQHPAALSITNLQQQIEPLPGSIQLPELSIDETFSEMPSAQMSAGVEIDPVELEVSGLTADLSEKINAGITHPGVGLDQAALVAGSTINNTTTNKDMGSPVTSPLSVASIATQALPTQPVPTQPVPTQPALTQPLDTPMQALSHASMNASSQATAQPQGPQQLSAQPEASQPGVKAPVLLATGVESQAQKQINAVQSGVNQAGKDIPVPVIPSQAWEHLENAKRSDTANLRLSSGLASTDATEKTPHEQRQVANQMFFEKLLTQTPQQNLRSDMLASVARSAANIVSSDSLVKGAPIADLGDSPLSPLTSLRPTVAVTSTSLMPTMQLATQVNQPGWSQDLGQKVSMMVSQDIKQAQLQLNPQNLGPMEVRISMGQDQQVSVTFTAQNVVVREALDGAATRLREMLEEQGFDLGEFNVSEETFQQQRERAKQNGVEDDEPDIFSQENDAIDSEILSVNNVASVSDNIVDLFA